MKTVYLTCLLALASLPAAAQQPNIEILRKIYERCARIEQGHYVVTERKKSFNRADTTETRQLVYFVNSFNSNLTPPYSAKITDLKTGIITIVDSGNVETVYHPSDSTSIKSGARGIHHVFDRFQPHTNKTGLFYVNEYPEHFKDLKIEETPTSYILTTAGDRQDPMMGATKGSTIEVIDKKTLLPIKQINTSYWKDMTQYVELTLSDFDFSPVTSAQLTLPKNLPVKEPTAAQKIDHMPIDTSKNMLKAGDQFPDMQLPLSNGTNYKLSADSAAVYIIDLWYIACAPCAMLAKSLENLQNKYASDPVRFMGVNPYDSARAVQNWLEKKTLRYHSCVQGKSFIRSIGFGQSYPVVIVLDRKRRVIDVLLGYGSETESKLDKHIREALRK